MLATATNGAGIKSVTVGAGSLVGALESRGTGGIGTVSVPKGRMQAALHATATSGAGIKSVTVGGGNMVGDLVSASSAGIGTVSVPKGGFSGAISAGHVAGAIKSLSVSGAISGGTVIYAGAGGVGAMTVKGNANVNLTTTGKVGLTVTGTATQPVTLSGIFDVRVLSSLSGTNADLSNLKVRATDGIGTVNVRAITASIFSAGTIGNVTTSKDMTGSVLLAGCDIGLDYRLTAEDGSFTAGTAKGNLGAVTIGGTMSRSSIAAGITPGGGMHFGDGNDLVVVSPSR
jgi:hypothetical protein